MIYCSSQCFRIGDALLRLLQLKREDVVDPIITRSFEGLRMWTLQVDWDPVIKNYREITSLTKDRSGANTEFTYSFGADKTTIVVLN